MVKDYCPNEFTRMPAQPQCGSQSAGAIAQANKCGHVGRVLQGRIRHDAYIDKRHARALEFSGEREAFHINNMYSGFQVQRMLIRSPMHKRTRLAAPAGKGAHARFAQNIKRPAHRSFRAENFFTRILTDDRLYNNKRAAVQSRIKRPGSTGDNNLSGPQVGTDCARGRSGIFTAHPALYQAHVPTAYTREKKLPAAVVLNARRIQEPSQVSQLRLRSNRKDG